MSKISAFSVLQIAGQAKARLPQDIHLTSLSWMTGDFVPDNISFEQFCSGKVFFFYWPRGKTKNFALNFRVDPKKVSTAKEWAEVGWNRGSAVLWFLLGLSVPWLPHERLGSFSWKCEATVVEMQSHQSRDIVLRQPPPKSFSQHCHGAHFSNCIPLDLLNSELG